MYENFKKGKDPKSVACEAIYRSIFWRNYHLSFHVPKKDQCAKCERYQYLDNGAHTTAEEEKRRQHLAKKDQARSEKAKDKERAKDEAGFKSVTFDLEKVLTTPCSEVSLLYYSRKLSVFNFTVYEQETATGYCYLWDESNGKRGSSEIGTCLYQYISSLPASIKHISFFSNTCGGQNRNQFVVTAMQQALHKNPHLQVVDQKFLVSGHT